MSCIHLFKCQQKDWKIQRYICYGILIILVAVAISLILLKVITKDKSKTTDIINVTSVVSTNGYINTTQVPVSNSNQTVTSVINQSSYWAIDASLISGRSQLGATLLANGKIIVTGGGINNVSPVSSCEFYLSSTGWKIAPSMKNYHVYHTQTLFANDTKVLVAGSAFPHYEKTAEVYDSVINTWTSTLIDMSNGRIGHAAVLLQNGQILIAGGQNSSHIVTATSELYIPSLNIFTNASSMKTGRTFFTSTLLNDGSTVVITGGGDINKTFVKTAELYISGSWVFTAGNMIQGRAFHAAVLLNNGNVLIVGGGNGGSYSLSSAEIYNSTTRTFASVGSMKYRRAFLTLTLLPSGKVLATGGVDWTTNTYPVTCELYDPVNRSWSDTNMLNTGRAFHQTILLNDSVLTIGGFNNSYDRLASCEKYYF